MKLLQALIDENYKFKRISKKDVLYKFYLEQSKELEDMGIVSFEIENIRNILRSYKYKDDVKEILNGIDKNIIYKSYKHGVYHNERVLIYSLVLSSLLEISKEDLKLVVYASMYHDIGRVNDSKDDFHGKRSASKLDDISLKLSNKDLNILKVAVSAHSDPNYDLSLLCKEYGVEDLTRAKLIVDILKDSDVLDRVRLEYPIIKYEFLKLKETLRLIMVAYELYYNFKLLKGDIKMNINDCKKYCHKFYKFKIRKIVDKQIDKYFEIEDSRFKLKQHSYKKGDEVILDTHHYLHGIGKSDKALDFVSENGIVSKDAATGIKGRHAFTFVSGFWRVNEKISLKEYIINYSGMDVTYEKSCCLVPYGKLDEFVEKMKDVDHFKWEAESSMEIRFMPSLARDINQYGFILDISSKEAQSLIENDINAKGYDRKISKYFGKLFDEKNDKRGICSFANRASYVIFGMNRCFIEGIVVGRKVENDVKALEELKQKFPECYVCNLDGIIILE
ncbi:MAG: HD domain-containing protein [Bacilli bacterium]|nr:HD domain-containing protein [Bacilli bacterium]